MKRVALRPTHDELLARARAGGSSALGDLLAQYRGYLTLLARVQIGRRLQGKVDPQDLVQEVFLEAHRHFGRFRGTSEAELTQWLRQILRAQLLHLLRRYFGTRGRDLRLERQLAEELDATSQALDRALVAPHSSPSQQATRREQAARLADALNQLPDDYRDVLVLRYLEGLRFPEIAPRMGRSVEATKKLWVRALDRLRRTIGISS